MPPMVLAIYGRGESMLSPKQEQFAKAIALDGMNYSDAYRSAYETKGMSDKTINEKASLMKDKDKIRARIKELRDKTDTPRVMSAQKRKEKLTKLAEDEDPIVAMKAIDLLNKMDGEYIQKVEAEVKNAVNIHIELSDE